MRVPIGIALALVIVAAPGLQGARAGELQVVDSRGQPIGTLAGLVEGVAQVLVEAAGAVAGLQVGGAGFVSTAFTATLFASGNCSGPPRLFDLASMLPGVTLIAREAGVSPDSQLVVSTDDPPALTSIASAWLPHRTPPCQTLPATMVPTFATSGALDLTAFVPPFALAGSEAGGGPSAGRPAKVAVTVDGVGQPLGLLRGAALPGGATTLFDVDGRPAPVFLLGDRPVAGPSFVVYAAGNCTGTPFLFQFSTPFPLVGVAGAQLLRDVGPAAPIAPGSFLSHEAVPQCETFPAGPSRPVRATSLLVDLGARPLPFGVEVREPGSIAPGGGRHGGGRFTIEDATGRTVGSAFVGPDLPDGADAVVLVRAGRRAGEVLLAGTGFRRGTKPARFESAGCAGPVLVQAEDPQDPVPLYPASALGPGVVLHSADGALGMADLQFRWDFDDADCVADPVGLTSVRGTSPLADLSAFTLPLVAR